MPYLPDRGESLSQRATGRKSTASNCHSTSTQSEGADTGRPVCPKVASISTDSSGDRKLATRQSRDGGSSSTTRKSASVTADQVDEALRDRIERDILAPLADFENPDLEW